MLKNISLLLLIFIGVSACSPVDRLIRRGDNALAIGEYAEAAALYQRAYRQTPAKEREQRGRLSYKMGDAYRCYGNVAKAVGNYENAASFIILIRSLGFALEICKELWGSMEKQVSLIRIL